MKILFSKIPLAVAKHSSTDSPQLRRAAITVGLRIAVAIAVMVAAVIVTAALYMLYLSHHRDLFSADTSTRVYIESNDMLKAMLLAGFVGILAAGAIGWLSARSAIRPLGRALELQRRFVQDASHELRTPLTILDARVQLAELKVTHDPDAAKLLGQIRQDTAALSATVQELLLAATGEHSTAIERLSLPSVVDEVSANLVDLAASRGIRLLTTHHGVAHVLIAPNSFRRAILGLIDNGINHTLEGGTVEICTAHSRGKAIITVSDNGGGIVGIDPARVFERFAHGSTAARGGPRSYGLGLALVHEIAVAAGGSIRVAATGPSGTTMELVLPISR